MIEGVEPRQLLTVPAYGWTLDAPAAKPVLWIDATGTGLTTSAGFRAENLNMPGTSFATPKGTDGLGRPTFGPASGTPADGNYEMTLPGTAFSPTQADDAVETDFFVNADFNHDRAVDFDDFLIWAQHYDAAATDRTYAQGDADGDGDVDNADKAILNARYNTRLAPAPSYDGEVTVSSLPVQADGSTPLVVNFSPFLPSAVLIGGGGDIGEAGDPNAPPETPPGEEPPEISGYSVYRSTDGTHFAKVGQVAADAPLAGPRHFQMYGYRDDTPVDGTKYYYRVRPFFAVTNPDGSAGIEHLSTTNKASRVSALPAPTLADAVTAGGKVFVSWSVRSDNESGFLVEQQNDAGAWVTLATTAAGANSYAFDTAGVTGRAATNAVRVRAINASIESAAVAVTPAAIAIDGSFDDEASVREEISNGEVSIVYDAGIAHANQTITIPTTSAGNLRPGQYALDGWGRTTLPLDGNRAETRIAQTEILLPNSAEAIVDIELFGNGTKGSPFDGPRTKWDVKDWFTRPGRVKISGLYENNMSLSIWDNGYGFVQNPQNGYWWTDYFRIYDVRGHVVATVKVPNDSTTAITVTVDQNGIATITFVEEDITITSIDVNPVENPWDGFATGPVPGGVPAPPAPSTPATSGR